MQGDWSRGVRVERVTKPQASPEGSRVWRCLDDRYTDGCLRIHQIHCVSGLVSDTLDTQTISRSVTTVRYTGYTRVSSQVSDTLDTYLSSRVLNNSEFHGIQALSTLMNNSIR